MSNVMSITPRLKKILIILLQKEEIISVKELAERIGVSKRTVQRELECVAHVLTPYHISFESKTGKGVWLSGAAEDKSALLSQLRQGDDYDVSNKEERRKRLVLEILKEKGIKKLFSYASRFQVSEATVSSDLEAVEGWLKEYGLTVLRKPGSGVEINGSEESYRRAIRAFIEENIDTRLLQDSYEVEEQTGSESILPEQGMAHILKDDILKRVVKCIAGMENQCVMSLTENSYTGLVLHISIAISRILMNEIVEQKEEWMEQLVRDADLELAEEIVRKLEQEFEVDIPEIETAYICLHIKGAKHQSIEWNGQKTIELERKELLGLINEMINAYDEKNAFAIKQDNEFIQGLLAHLQPTFIRLVHDMKISNPVLSEIKASYPDIFEKSKCAALVMEQCIGKRVPEEEIGFLAIHFGAAQVRLEGRKENIRRVHVGIVCASGIGISRLMLSKLDKIFKDRIQMEPYGKSDITPYIIGRTDFFVSSIPLKQIDADVLQVNPLLSAEDITAINQKLYHYERLPRREQEETAFTAELEQINIMAMQIKTILRYLEVFKVSNDVTFRELVDAISRKMSPYGDRQAMIQEAIEEREKLGSQIFAEFGFGLLHTRTEGVVRPTFSVCLTKDGEAFRDKYFKGIHVILIMLLPMDDHIKINSEILGYISSILIEDYDFLLTVSGGNRSEIETALSTRLRKFFAQYLNKIQG